MVTGGIERLLIYNPGAGSVDDQILEILRAAFFDHEFRGNPFDPSFLELLAPAGATVIACGGDGTVSAVARTLAGTPHTLGILAMGTFNNFARSLGLPTTLEDAIEVVKSGQPGRAKVGRVNGHRFLEAAAVGFFGDAIALGEAAKELAFGELGDRLRMVAEARPFRFKTEGDVAVRGQAFSLIVANTPSIGALIPVGDTSPEEPELELVVNPGGRRIARRMLGSLLRRAPDLSQTYRVRRLRVSAEPEAAVYADASSAGTTPAEIGTVAGGVRVILPA